MRTTLTLILALVASAAATGTAAAATTVLRPNATTMIQSPWTVSPFGTTADAVLDDAVVQPGAPSTAGDLLTVSGMAAGPYTMLAFPAPNLPAGTTPTAVTAWVYASVGAGQTLTPSAWHSTTMLGFRTLLTSGAAWRSVTLWPTPSAAQLGQIALWLRADGFPGSAATKVYAAYLEIDTPDAAGGGTDDTATTGSDPGTSTDPAGDDPPASDPGDAPTEDSPLGRLAPPVAIGLPAAVDLPAQAQELPVTLSCPADAGGACHGNVQVRLLGAAPVRRGKARAARCARGCRVIGSSSFTIAAGKQKPVRVRLRPAAMRIIPRGHAARVQITVTSRSSGHRARTSSRTVTIRRHG